MVLVAIAGSLICFKDIFQQSVFLKNRKDDAYDADRLSCYDRLHVNQCASRCYTLLGSRWCVQLSANIHHKRYDETTFESTSGRRVETKPAKTSRHSKKDVTESAKPANNKQATKQIKQPKTVQTTKAATQESSRSGSR